MVLVNREIIHNSPIEFIEHKTGKKVKSWKRLENELRTIIIFTDNTCCYLNPFDSIDEIEFQPMPKSFCACCGEETHYGYFDWAGRCEIYLKRLWEKARKVFWYRYIKNGHKNPLNQLKDK